MPVLRFSKQRMEKLSGMTLDELREALFRLKCETSEDGDHIVVEVNADRPDMFIGEGVARAVRSLAGRESAWRAPEVVDSGIKIEVRDVPQRPYIVAAVAYDVNIDSEEYIQELIQFQEKLNEGLGRRRRKAAIGFHDLAKLPSKELAYEMVSVEREFLPLGSKSRAKISDVLEGSEKGQVFGHIARLGALHPAIVANGEIIAIPPVLNSEITRIEPGTRDVFIDVTATDLQTASSILDIIAYNLAERGGRLGSVAILYGSTAYRYPELKERTIETSPQRINSILGTELSVGQVIEILARMGYRTSVGGEGVSVGIPPYRADVMGEVDIAEDVAIYIGYDNLSPRKAPILYALRGSLSGESRLIRRLRELMIGMGFTEVMQLSLTSPSLLQALGIREGLIEVANPVQIEYSVLRPMIAVSMLRLLSENSHARKPVKVFEIGPVARANGGIADEEHLAMAIMDEEVSYELIQAPLYAVLRAIGAELTVSPANISFLMKGRAAHVHVRGHTIGFLGEVEPAVLESLGIYSPVAIAEISISTLSRLLT